MQLKFAWILGKFYHFFSCDFLCDTNLAKTNIVNFWQSDEFSATMSDPFVPGKWKLAIKLSWVEV